MKQVELDGLIQLADGHQQADQYKSGSYNFTKSACAIGCTMHDAKILKLIPESVEPGNHASLETVGVPELAWRLCDLIFEGVLEKDRSVWTPRFLRSIRAEADYTFLPARITVRLSAKLASDVIDPTLRPICETICNLWTRCANGKDPSREEWVAVSLKAEAARDQVDVAKCQTDTACRQAYAVRRQADAAKYQADAAKYQANAAKYQAAAAKYQATAAKYWDSEKFWQWCGDMLCEELSTNQM